MREVYEYYIEIEGPGDFHTADVPIGVLMIGRQPGNDLELFHPMVSRRHAQISCDASGCQIVDLGSANGTKLDGMDLTPQVAARLAPESVITIGPFKLTLKATSVQLEGEFIADTDEVKVSEPPADKPAQIPDDMGLPAISTPVGAPPSPPPPSTPPEIIRPPSSAPGDGALPADIFTQSTRLLQYLPGIYHNSFMSSFLAMFESIWTPIEWSVDHYDLFLDPGTAPVGALPWLAQWFQIDFDTTWDENRRRTFLKEAHQIFAMRGTRWALNRALQIYTGCEPQIMDCVDDEEPFRFSVHLPVSPNKVSNELVEAIIEACKPAQTTYTLTYQEPEK